MSIHELFETTNATETTIARGLTGTAELTRLASNIADSIIRSMEADIENYRPRIQESAADSKALDAIIDELGEINPDDAQFLMELDDATIDGMLKSQQSKRSRAKGKQMTLDNYRTLMTAAIAENIIRLVTGRTKQHIGYSRGTGSVDYTIEQLEALGADQIALRKEIRNIQSKKSIMKSKADFDETSEKWQALLKAEQQLKDLRVTNTQVVEVDTTKDALSEVIGDVDVKQLKADEAREMLERLQELL